MRIALCDDDTSLLQALHDEILQCYTNISIALFSSGKSLVEHYKMGKPFFDIIVLDIIMPETTGYEAAKQVRLFDSTVTILFLTSTTDYLMEGYSVQIYDYILKPLNMSKLKESLDKAIHIASIRDKTLFIHSRKNVFQIYVKDIIYAMRDDRKVVVYTLDSDPIFCDISVTALENDLPKGQFIRSDSAYIINLAQVLNINNKNRTVLMRDGSSIPISRPRFKSVIAALYDFAGR